MANPIRLEAANIKVATLPQSKTRFSRRPTVPIPSKMNAINFIISPFYCCNLNTLYRISQALTFSLYFKRTGSNPAAATEHTSGCLIQLCYGYPSSKESLSILPLSQPQAVYEFAFGSASMYFLVLSYAVFKLNQPISCPPSTLKYRSKSLSGLANGLAFC